MNSHYEVDFVDSNNLIKYFLRVDVSSKFQCRIIDKSHLKSLSWGQRFLYTTGLMDKTQKNKIDDKIYHSAMFSTTHKIPLRDARSFFRIIKKEPFLLKDFHHMVFSWDESVKILNTLNMLMKNDEIKELSTGFSEYDEKVSDLKDQIAFKDRMIVSFMMNTVNEHTENNQSVAQESFVKHMSLMDNELKKI